MTNIPSWQQDYEKLLASNGFQRWVEVAARFQAALAASPESMIHDEQIRHQELEQSGCRSLARR